MGTDDKIDAKAEELQGKIKEGVGDATDDRDLEAEGKADQTKGNLKQAGEKIKDAFRELTRETRRPGLGPAASRVWSIGLGRSTATPCPASTSW